MPTVDRVRDRGVREARRIAQELGRELRDARLDSGLSQRRVAEAAGLVQSQVSRAESGGHVPEWLEQIATHCATLGLRLNVRPYPSGSPVRDAGQLRLLSRFRRELADAWKYATEVLVGGYGDLRAWDAFLRGSGGSVGIDAETRLYDIQALDRRLRAKRRDSGVDRVVLLVARTRHNRAVLLEHREALRSTFPADTHEVISALRRGELPARNGVVVL